MSHRVVLVAEIENSGTVEEQLEPFCEEVDETSPYAEKDEDGDCYNPNAQWDWWTYGGRWTNWLAKKDGTRCSSCRVDELDLEVWKNAEMENAGKQYDKEIEQAKARGREPFFWEKEVPTREEYIKRFDMTPAPYAFIRDGEWVERGAGAWETETDEEWAKEFENWLRALPPKSIIIVADCHI